MPRQQQFQIQPFSSEHDAWDFDCGVSILNEFIRQFASQQGRKGYGRTYVLIEEGDKSVLGFYTLAAGSVRFEYLPESHRKKVPKHPMPVAHLARLAVDGRLQSQGLGSLLVMDALLKIDKLADGMGIAAVEVVAKGDRARNFYIKLGFSTLEDDTLHLYMPIRTIRALLEEASAGTSTDDSTR